MSGEATDPFSLSTGQNGPEKLDQWQQAGDPGKPLTLTFPPASLSAEKGGIPAASAILLGFAGLLRKAGFSIAPEQAIGFMQAVTLLGPRSMRDIREAALAIFAPSPDRRAEFEVLFTGYFWGDLGVTAQGESGEETRVKDEGASLDQLSEEPRREKGGELSSSIEQLADRDFRSDDDDLAAFRRSLSTELPMRRSFRYNRSPRGKPDLRHSLRAIVRNDGDVPLPSLRRRQLVQRKILLLIDVSGSMKLHTTDYLKVAHAVAQAAQRAEIFTIGTRLTRITASLRLRDREQALSRVASQVDDWDGGTRIGPTLLAFLSLPRFAAFARGASVVVLSDGLERGSHEEMETAFRRLSARSFRLSLCTPLAADPRFRPETTALRAVLPMLDDLVDASSVLSLTRFILSLARPAPAAEMIWRKVS